MEKTRLDYLKAMGVAVWERRESSGTGQKINEETPVKSAEELPVSQLDLKSLREHVTGCTLCPLHQSRTQTVFGEGDPQADLMFIGEGPGAREDEQGEPFVGRAGQLLNSMLAAIGLSREEVFIANIVKCRPPNNRDPQPEEVSSCTPYLVRQIELIQPKIIVALGRVAAQFLLKTNQALGKLRGEDHQYQETPLIVTYHPAYLLRSPTQKAKAWEDLVRVQSAL